MSENKPRPRPEPNTTQIRTGGASYGIAMALAYFAIAFLVGLIIFGGM
jgi:hypothetical protein